MKRMITAVLIAVIFASGIANAALQCCGRMPDAGIVAADTATVAGDNPCHEAQPPCRALGATPPNFTAAGPADGDAGAACCKSDRKDKSRPAGFLRASAPPYPLALDQQANPLEAADVAGGAVAPETRRAFPPTTPIYLLKNAILR